MSRLPVYLVTVTVALTSYFASHSVATTASAEQSGSLGYWSEADLSDIDIKKLIIKGKATQGGWDRYARKQNARVQSISRKLESYIQAWARGENDGRIPKGMLPRGLDNDKLGDWQIVKPDQVKEHEQWWVRPAHPIDMNELYFLYPDNHCTYAKIAFIAPLGSTLHLEGQYPHSRFFDLQVSEPYDPYYPATVGFGAGEVPIVDVDINPKPGHQNPFRPGTSRQTLKRGYHVKFEMAAGNAAMLNPSFKPPAYRGPGNTRVGGPFRDGGPAFDGLLHPGILWLRYYLPDKKYSPMGGVPLPKAWFTLKTGEKFWIKPRSLKTVAQRQNKPVISRKVQGQHPKTALDERWGWIKGFGIALAGFELQTREELADENKIKQGIGKGLIRAIDANLFNRGPDRGAPGSYAVTATGCSYIHYLHRGMSILPGYVAVVTGRMPTTPNTFESTTKLSPAQARYWSIVHYDTNHKGHPGVLMGSLCDEHIVTRNSEYCIVFSTGADRPANSHTHHGVTWNEWGTVGKQMMIIRWLTVEGDWEDPAITPNETNAPWEKCAWSQKTYNERILGRNKPGLLREYHPVVHYMSKKDFERIGAAPGLKLKRKVHWQK